VRETTYSRWRPHPWHGLLVGPQPPEVVHAYIEITPYDLIKYEVDKATGYLRVDRPQRTSSQPPTLYGFVPQTYCGPRVGALCPGAAGGDRDPLDICVVSERPIDRAEIVLSVRVLGGIQTLDGGKADDKIIGVLENDNFWGAARDLTDLPPRLVERLQHYFATYKLVEGQSSQVVIQGIYHAQEARRVVAAAIDDYREEFASTG
jgi:inorganic pyrophosphatase